MTRRKKIITTVLLILLGGLACVVYAFWHVRNTVYDAYAVWNTAELINDYMDAHEGGR